MGAQSESGEEKKKSKRIEESSLRGEILRTLFVLALPTIVEEVLATLLQYVDTAMVGHLGEEATAAVSVTTTVSWLISSVPSALSVAVLSLIAKAVGSGDRQRLRRISSQVLLLAVGCGLVMGGISMALSPFIPVWMGADVSIQRQASVYFCILCSPMVFRACNSILGAAIRATKDTKTPMYINLGANVLNVFLNYFLIYGVGWGVTGAAIASAISYTIAGGLMFAAYRKKELLRWEWKELVPDKEVLEDCARVSVPVLMTNVASCFGYVVFASLVTGMGNTIFAAHSIAVTAETIFYLPGYGLRTATSTLVGIALGEQNRKRFETVVEFSVLLTMGMMVLSGVVLYLVSLPLMSLFTNSEQVARIGAEMLRIVAFSEPFFGLMVVMEGIFYGLGKSKYPFFVETFSMWGVRILFTYISVNIWGLGLRQVWYCMIADNICKAVLLTLPIVSGKGRKNLFLLDSCSPTETMI